MSSNSRSQGLIALGWAQGTATSSPSSALNKGAERAQLLGDRGDPAQGQGYLFLPMSCRATLFPSPKQPAQLRGDLPIHLQGPPDRPPPPLSKGPSMSWMAWAPSNHSGEHHTRGTFYFSIKKIDTKSTAS